MRQTPPDSEDARDHLQVPPADDLGLSGLPSRPPDEGPSEADIEESERASSGNQGKWLARAGIVILIVAIASMIIPMLMVIFPPDRAAPAVPASSARGTVAVVTRVIDGRTIEVQIDGKAAIVRYLGIKLPDDDLWREWSARVNRDWVSEKTVVLERDVTDTDSEGRLLRYVWLDDLLVNGGIIAAGLGTFAVESPDLRYAPDLARYERNARQGKVGMWQATGA